MRTTFHAAAAGLLLTLYASATPATAAPGPLRIIGTPQVAYWDYSNPKGKSKGVVYQFQTNRPLRKGWEVRMSGMSVLFVSRGGKGTCYNGEFGVGTDIMQGIHRLLRPGKLVTLEVREPRPFRKAHRGVRAQRFSGSRQAFRAAASGCRK